jgi:hypothetical protein
VTEPRATGTDQRRRRRARRGVSAEAFLYLGIFFTLIVFLAHGALLDLPYYWDEVGQFIPATFDLYTHGDLIPSSVKPNVHPPGLMLYLTFFWKLFWPGVEVTRAAMVLMGSMALLAAFLLGVELCAWTPGLPALAGVLLLGISPTFFMQSFLAQLDMPALLFSCLGLYWFLRERMVWSASACVLLVAFKETGVLLPVVLGVWLLFERRWKAAAWFLTPVAVLGAWLFFLTQRTGFLLGSAEFTRYNLNYPLSPIRIAFALARRALFLGVEQGHFLAVVAVLVAWRSGQFAHRRWRIAGLFFVLHVLLVSVLGGAILERYLLPILPIYYMAAAVGISSLRGEMRAALGGGLALLLLASLFWYPPWPFPYENNFAMVDFVRIQQQAAFYLEERYPDRVITTAWPLSAELRRPEFGYVRDGLRTDEELTFSRASFAKRPPGRVQVFVLYSRDWDPPADVLLNRYTRWVGKRLLAYGDAITGEEVPDRFGLQMVRRMTKGNQWVEIYALPEATP